MVSQDRRQLFVTPWVEAYLRTGNKRVIPYLFSVFRIHDILVWIRIRIRGSMPLTLPPDPDPDADADPAIFVIDLQDTNKKQIF